jgi:hypothetical protein
VDGETPTLSSCISAKNAKKKKGKRPFFFLAFFALGVDGFEMPDSDHLHAGRNGV